MYTQEQKAEAWSKAAGMVQTYSDEMIKRWKEEIDTYLVFVRRCTIAAHESTLLSKEHS